MKFLLVNYNNLWYIIQLYCDKEVNKMYKEPLDKEKLKEAHYKFLDDTSLHKVQNFKPVAINFFLKDGIHCFCRRYNNIVNYDEAIKSTDLCRKCGMRFDYYSASLVCIFSLYKEYYTLKSVDEAKKITSFPDREEVLNEKMDFEWSKWR